MNISIGRNFLAASAIAFLLALPAPSMAASFHYDISFSSLSSEVLKGSFDYDTSTELFSDFTVTWKRGELIPSPYLPSDPLYADWVAGCDGRNPCGVHETWTFDFTANANMHAPESFALLNQWLPISPAPTYMFIGVIGPAISQPPFFAFGNSGSDLSLWSNNVAMTTDIADPNYFILHPFSLQGPYALSFPVAAPIPEPETYALLLAGLGLLGLSARVRCGKCSSVKCANALISHLG